MHAERCQDAAQHATRDSVAASALPVLGWLSFIKHACFSVCLRELS